MSNLAILGGKPEIQEKLKKYVSIGNEEKIEIEKVLESGCISGFYGSWRDGFLGGEKVQKFEKRWSDKFKVNYTISVNSNTSGLYAAMGAIGISPGDEVIVPPTTMSATAVCPIIYGGIPVFADIEDETFCISVESVKQNITSKTKAIIAVNLFGHPSELKKLKKLADDNGIYLIEDNAQSILAQENDQYTGTIGHIGVFSLNYHKHIHTGEGGMCCTNDKELALRLQCIRNHAEAVVEDAQISNLINMIGFNFRMTELSAAIGLAQLNKINNHLEIRKHFATQLSNSFNDLEGLIMPKIRENCSHSFYNWAVKFDENKLGIKRDTFIQALQAEGFPCFGGYVKPQYFLPLFQNKIALGNKNFPFNLTNREYSQGLCPTAEDLYKNKFLCLEICAWEIDEKITSQLINAFHKVYSSINEIRNL